jgi:hypothetical protein
MVVTQFKTFLIIMTSTSSVGCILVIKQQAELGEAADKKYQTEPFNS